MKILVILPFNRLWYAGTPILFNLIKGFTDVGHEVHIVLFNKTKDEEVSLRGLYVYSFGLPLANLRSNIKVLNWIYAKILYFLFILLAVRKSLEIAKKIKPDVVYGFASSGAVAAYFVAKIKNILNVTRIFGTFLYPFINHPIQLLLRFDEFLAFKIPCKYLIITNDGTKGDEVARSLGVPSERIKFWMNGVDDMYDPNFNTEEFKKSIGISEDKKIVLSVSRLVGWKRVDRIINAIPLVVSQYKDVIFLVVGDGEERNNLENLANKLNIKDYIKFIGAVSHEKIIKYMNSADIFVSMYNLSNMGNPLLEAMRCGKCIVTLNTGATGEIIQNNKNGILLDTDNVNGVSGVIIKLLNDEKLRKTLGINVREYASNHFQSWNERIQMEINLIEKIRNKNGKK